MQTKTLSSHKQKRLWWIFSRSCDVVVHYKLEQLQPKSWNTAKAKVVTLIPLIGRKHAAMLRGVQRWLKRNHYRRGKRSGNIVLKEHIAAKRDKFLIEFFANRSLPQETQLREVYLDESYIHQHYKKNTDSLYDPNDEQDLQVGKEKNKGHRYCFLCAIQGPNRESSLQIWERMEGYWISFNWQTCSQQTEVGLFLVVYGPSAPSRRNFTKETITRSSIQLTSLSGGTINFYPTYINLLSL